MRATCAVRRQRAARVRGLSGPRGAHAPHRVGARDRARTAGGRVRPAGRVRPSPTTHFCPICPSDRVPGDQRIRSRVRAATSTRRCRSSPQTSSPSSTNSSTRRTLVQCNALYFTLRTCINTELSPFYEATIDSPLRREHSRAEH